MPLKNDKIVWGKYFILKAIHCGCIPEPLFYLFKNNEMYLSSKGELSSPLEMAHLETKLLAEKFKNKCIKRLKKRYGEMFDLGIVECSTCVNKTIQNRIKIDSGKIKQRLAAGNIVPPNGIKRLAMPACIE